MTTFRGAGYDPEPTADGRASAMAERDRARACAVALEQELTELRRVVREFVAATGVTDSTGMPPTYRPLWDAMCRAVTDPADEPSSGNGATT